MLLQTTLKLQSIICFDDCQFLSYVKTLIYLLGCLLYYIVLLSPDKSISAAILEIFNLDFLTILRIIFSALYLVNGVVCPEFNMIFKKNMAEVMYRNDLAPPYKSYLLILIFVCGVASFVLVTISLLGQELEPTFKIVNACLGVFLNSIALFGIMSHLACFGVYIRYLDKAFGQDWKEEINRKKNYVETCTTGKAYLMNIKTSISTSLTLFFSVNTFVGVFMIFFGIRAIKTQKGLMEIMTYATNSLQIVLIPVYLALTAEKYKVLIGDFLDLHW